MANKPRCFCCKGPVTTDWESGYESCPKCEGWCSGCGRCAKHCAHDARCRPDD